MLEKRSLRIAGHATSVRLEPEFWAALAQVAAAERTTLSALVETVDAGRGAVPLAQALRLCVLRALLRASAPPADES